MESRPDKITQFLKEINKLKEIEREIYSSDSDRKESDADHTWHLAMFILTMEKDLDPKLDRMKLLKMALIHDLPEIYAGDTWAFSNEKAKEGKKAREKEAAIKLFSQLPEDLEKEFLEIFNEYEESITEEAKTVKALDKIQPILTNVVAKGKSWKKNKVSMETVDRYKRPYMVHNKKILEIYEQLMNESKEKDLFGTE